jgi:hypothetical protein
MRIIKSQSLMIRAMLFNFLRATQPFSESRAQWIDTWWDSMETIFSTFQALRIQNLAPIRELEERLIA